MSVCKMKLEDETLSSYIKDTNHALEIFRDFNFSSENKLIFSMDITSLYALIPNNEGLQTPWYFSARALLKNPARKHCPV